MTREERDYAKSRIEYLLKICRFDEHDKEALEMAIKALSQEPCTDAVSREAVMKIAKCISKKAMPKYIDKLPSVNPQPCDDAISRKAVFNAICDYVAFEEYEDKSHTFTIRPLTKRIKQLPSVNPQYKECRTLDEFIKEQTE